MNIISNLIPVIIDDTDNLLANISAVTDFTSGVPVALVTNISKFVTSNVSFTL